MEISNKNSALVQGIDAAYRVIQNKVKVGAATPPKDLSPTFLAPTFLEDNHRKLELAAGGAGS